MQPQNELDKFFEDLPKGEKKVADVFEDKPAEEAAPKPGDSEESEGRKNRRHRRLEEQLRAEKDSNIALNERIKVLSEVEKFSKEHEGEIDPRLARAFGTNDQGKEFSKIITDLLKENTEKAKEEALKEFESREARVETETKGYENFIDSQLENLEDQHDIDLTSNEPAARKARREFLEMVQDLSPKDENGTITGYADFESTFGLYQRVHSERSSDTVNKQKDMASRSMQRSGQGAQGTPKITPGFDGWRKDFGIE